MLLRGVTPTLAVARDVFMDVLFMLFSPTRKGRKERERERERGGGGRKT